MSENSINTGSNADDISEKSYEEEKEGEQQSFFCRPLGFDNFLLHSKEKLNQVFNTKFKKDKVFNDLLLEICKEEIH